MNNLDIKNEKKNKKRKEKINLLENEFLTEVQLRFKKIKIDDNDTEQSISLQSLSENFKILSSDANTNPDQNSNKEQQIESLIKFNIESISEQDENKSDDNEEEEYRFGNIYKKKQSSKIATSFQNSNNFAYDENYIRNNKPQNISQSQQNQNNNQQQSDDDDDDDSNSYSQIAQQISDQLLLNDEPIFKFSTVVVRDFDEDLENDNNKQNQQTPKTPQIDNKLKNKNIKKIQKQEKPEKKSKIQTPTKKQHKKEEIQKKQQYQLQNNQSLQPQSILLSHQNNIETNFQNSNLCYKGENEE